MGGTGRYESPAVERAQATGAQRADFESARRCGRRLTALSAHRAHTPDDGTPRLLPCARMHRTGAPGGPCPQLYSSPLAGVWCRTSRAASCARRAVVQRACDAELTTLHKITRYFNGQAAPDQLG